LLTLATVLAIEYILKIPPCKLCEYQRLPYVGLVIVSLLGCLIPKMKKNISYIILLLFFASTCMAFFIVGVEEQWFKYHSACISDTNLKTNSFEEFKKNIMEKDIISCDLNQYNIMGLSLTAWNLIVSIIMLIFSFTLISTSFKEERT